MCGIAALLGSQASVTKVTAMTDAMCHRGPDDRGTYAEPGLALGHRRLSIVDLSAAGHQPMVSHNGRYRIVFNGEIFNFQEIARRLPNVRWRSASDTEVLLEAFAAWGPACLDHLVGMYAFAIWDAAERRLFCARDRLGIKPFYYSRLGEGWAVASEIGGLLAAGVEPRPNPRMVYDFLARDFYEHCEDSFFAGIDKLAAGHWMCLTPGQVPTPVRYWDLAKEAAAVELPASREARAEALLAHMQDAVGVSLRSDVPVGITLSGGLDSAVLLALVDRAQPDQAKIGAQSFDFDDAAYSERPWVEAMSRHLGHQVSFRTVSPEDFTATLDTVIRQQQEPHAGVPITAYTLCFEALRNQGTIVAMDGSGIDEGLAGYSRFQPALWADLRAAGDSGELAAEFSAAGIVTEADRARAFRQMDVAASPFGDVGRAQDLSRSIQPDCLGPALKDIAVPLPEFERPFPDALRNLMYRELRYTKLPRALRFRDRLSMAYGCELRPPFLDHRLLAYMFALPASDRIHRGVTKSILREAATRYLPEVVRLAAKRSVQTPQREWFRGPLANWVWEQIDSSAFWQLGWVKRDAALETLRRFQAGEGDNSFFVWQWINLNRWSDYYFRR